MKPYNHFDFKIMDRYYDIIDDEKDRRHWTTFHLFRPYNENILKIGTHSEYYFYK